MAIACAVAAGVAAQAESNHADLAAELQAEIQKAQPDRYLLLLQACIDNAVKYAAEKKIEQRLLTLDRAIGNQWLVASGIAAGDHLVVEGLQKVRPGMPVREVSFQAPQQASAQPAPATK